MPCCSTVVGGGGTQRQLLRTPVSLTKIQRILISHLHGDHIFGLPGLLTSHSMSGTHSPLQLYGPPGLEEAKAIFEPVTLAQDLDSISLWAGYPIRWRLLLPQIFNKFLTFVQCFIYIPFFRMHGPVRAARRYRPLAHSIP